MICAAMKGYISTGKMRECPLVAVKKRFTGKSDVIFKQEIGEENGGFVDDVVCHFISLSGLKCVLHLLR
jgi:hypothetical protein